MRAPLATEAPRRRALPVDAVALQRDTAAAICARGQRAGDAVHGKRQVVEAAVLKLAAHVVKGRHARKGPIGLDQGKRSNSSLSAPSVRAVACRTCAASAPSASRSALQLSERSCVAE